VSLLATFVILNWSEARTDPSSSQERGIEMGAPGRARVENAATDVAPRWFRR
jgi:hypothetical protein